LLIRSPFSNHSIAAYPITSVIEVAIADRVLPLLMIEKGLTLDVLSDFCCSRKAHNKPVSISADRMVSYREIRLVQFLK
jgi:hypothetical protein